MGNAILTRRFGSGLLKSTDAMLRVISFTGATVTISKNGSVMESDGHERASDTNTEAFCFIISQSSFDSNSPWTITSSWNGIVTTDSVIIDTASEYNVTVLGNLYLYNQGVYTSLYSNANVTTNGSVTDYDSYIYLASTSGSSKFAIYKWWVSVETSYWNTVTLDIDGHVTSGNSGDFVPRIFATQNGSLTYAGNASAYNNTKSGAASWTNFVVTLDISSLTGLWYIGVGTDSQNSSWNYRREGRINSVLLSR